ncbi:MAG TPA: DUF222 domain-containing protein [Acidimicrobiales bacterium]|nr:DUF222 domain-containing protein [Acidimicrobiales bacterium]
MTQAIDALAALDPTQLGDGESVVDLHRELARLDAVATRAVGSFDASRAWESTGARSAAAWMSVECRLPSSTARRRVRLARALRHLPATEDAWLCGEINDFQVGLLAMAQFRAPKEFASVEEDLVDWAKGLRFRHFAQVLAYWIQRADPDGDERNAKKQHDSRRASLSQSFGHMWFLDGVFDPIGGEILSTALGKIEDELFVGDWAEAKSRVGESVCATDLPRTTPQRRADAVVEMARRAMAMAPGSRLPDPLFVAFVDHPDTTKRISELASGTVVSPGSLVPWLDQAWIERVVWEGPSRILDIGERRRLFRGATREAVQLRDRECFHRYCEERAEYCDVDHIVPYSEGGLTNQANGQPGCGFHNRNKGSERGPPP